MRDAMLKKRKIEKSVIRKAEKCKVTQKVPD